jgi:glycyl-tRNA synthetase beta chain
MEELIFEIGCEELPARFLEDALVQLRTLVESSCAAQRIDLQHVRVMGTPRRLTLVAGEVAPMQRDLSEERTGPPSSAAFKDGKPTKAAEGFARGLNLPVEDLYTIQTPRGEYVAARVQARGLPTRDLLPALLTEAIGKIAFPKSMRWGAGRSTFARPVRWIVATLGHDVLPVKWAGVEAGRHTFGHRFAAPQAIEVKNIRQYTEALAAAHVTVEPAVRRARIEAMLQLAADEAGGTLVHDAGLLDEVTNLIEQPHCVLVRFDAKYLEVPAPVLIISMRSHQRYFAIRDAKGDLLNACAVIYNTPVHDPAVVRDGNLRVLKARLDDARFFFDQDLKRSLADRLPDLERVTWVGKLGSLAERAQRISHISGAIARALNLPAAEVAHAERAGLLAKADLVTSLVSEFTELQGVIGGAYAARTGEHPLVAQAIEEQYLPKGPDDAIPASDVGGVVALAERLDTLVGCFGIGMAPRSNADPYGLRRAALGVLRVLQGRGWGLGLTALLTFAYDAYRAQGKHAAFSSEQHALLADVLSFIVVRLENLLTAEFSKDVVDAVLAAAADEVLSVRDRVEALAALRADADFEPLAIGFKRVVNILRKQADDHFEIPAAVNLHLLQDAQEHALHAAAEEQGAIASKALKARDWSAACRALIALKAPIDDFFDHVMVMADDSALKANRLALLDSLRRMFMQVADVSRIQVDGK